MREELSRVDRVLRESGPAPQGLKPSIKKWPYRSDEPLRHPKAIFETISSLLPFSAHCHRLGNDRLQESHAHLKSEFAGVVGD